MNSTLSYKDYLASIEVSAEDNCLHGRIEFIEDLVTFEADTVPELVRAFEAAVDDYLESCKAIGKAPDKPFKGTFNVRIGPDLHKRAAVAALKAGQALNEFVKVAVEKNLADGTVVHHEHHHKVEMTTNTIFPMPQMQPDQWLIPKFNFNDQEYAGSTNSWR